MELQGDDWTSEGICSFTYPGRQSVFSEHLFCARPCARTRDIDEKTDASLGELSLRAIQVNSPLTMIRVAQGAMEDKRRSS